MELGKIKKRAENGVNLPAQVDYHHGALIAATLMAAISGGVMLIPGARN